jgi:outer membrane receptor protein involved in Fe transport
MGDFNLVKASAAANIPINDSVAFRGTVFSTQRDGIVDDVNLGEDLYNDRDRVGARLQLAINDVDDPFNMRIIADYAEIDEICCVAMANIDSLILKGALPAIMADPTLLASGFGLGSDFGNAALGGTVFATHNYLPQLLDGLSANPLVTGTIIQGAKWEDYVTAYNKPPVSQNEDMGLSIEINKELTDSVTLKSISAYRAFETFDDADVDFSDVDLIGRTNFAEQSSFSQEFQFIGEFGEGSSWVAGAYYFGQDLDSETRTTAESLLNTFAKIGDPTLNQIIGGVNAIDAGLDQLSLLTGDPTFAALLGPATEPFPAGANAFDIVKQDHSGYAVFGQVDWSITDMFTLSLGARYTDETKDIDATYVQTANGPPPDAAAISGCLVSAQTFLLSGGALGSLDCIVAGDLLSVSEPSQAWGLWGFVPFAPRSDVKDTLEDDQTTGTVKLTFFPADSTMLYLSYATGFKAGGTNADRVNEFENIPQIFQAETSESIELGWKGQYGPVQLALTLYQTDFDDFQANSFAGGGFILKNAGTLAIEGVELELLWRPTDSTEIQAWYAHNDGTYDSFEEGVGWDAWVLQYGVWQNPPQGDPGCQGPPDPSNLPEICSRTGDKVPYNPEDRAFVALTQQFELGANTSGFFRLEYSYGSEQTTDGDNDPLTLSDGYEIVNARLGFNFDNINSSLTFWGRNITDERFYYGSFDIPFSYDKTMSYPSEPATYGVTFRKNFD